MECVNCWVYVCSKKCKEFPKNVKEWLCGKCKNCYKIVKNHSRKKGNDWRVK